MRHKLKKRFFQLIERLDDEFKRCGEYSPELSVRILVSKEVLGKYEQMGIDEHSMEYYRNCIALYLSKGLEALRVFNKDLDKPPIENVPAGKYL
jgi:hypothetical protein